MKEIARAAAWQALQRWDASPDGSKTDYVADAVTVAVSQEWARYRPQHADNCASWLCVCGFALNEPPPAHWEKDSGMHPLKPKPCSCGLNDLLSALSVRPERHLRHEQAMQQCLHIINHLTTELLKAGAVHHADGTPCQHDQAGGPMCVNPTHLLSALSVRPERELEEDDTPIGPASGYDDEDHGAGLIGQVASPLAETEPRQNKDLPVCVVLARERLSSFVNDGIPISPRELREMLSAVVVEYEALYSQVGRAQDASSRAGTE